MKILFISHKHPPSMGGMETQNFHLVSEINKDHEVLKIIIAPGQSRLSYFLSLKKRVKAVLISNPDIDIIHLNDGLMAFTLHWLPAFTETPIVVTYHGLDLIFPSAFYQKRLRKYQRPNCYFVAVSEYTKERGIESGINTDHIKWINNGVDHEFGSEIVSIDKKTLFSKFSIPFQEDQIYLVSIGRAVPRKGISWFIENVMPSLNENFHYIIIGPNNVTGLTKLLLKFLPDSWSRFLSTLMGFTTDFEKARCAAIRQGIQNRVHFLGGIPFEELVNTLRISDIMVMPNIRFKGDMEGFGLVILEANISNKFVLASNVEGITSAIHPNKNGMLITSEAQEEWITKINTYCQSKDFLIQKGQEAHNYVLKNFSWTKMTKEYEQFFIDIVAQQH